jgi:hypothetical protein
MKNKNFFPEINTFNWKRQVKTHPSAPENVDRWLTFAISSMRAPPSVIS